MGGCPRKEMGKLGAVKEEQAHFAHMRHGKLAALCSSCLANRLGGVLVKAATSGQDLGGLHFLCNVSRHPFYYAKIRDSLFSSITESSS